MEPANTDRSATLLWYHGRCYGRPAPGAESTVVNRKAVTLLADDRSGDFAARLENKLGFKCAYFIIGQTGEQMPGLPDEEIDRLVTEIQSTAATK